MLRFDINLVFTVINILIIYFLMKRFLFKPINQILEARRADIGKQYEDARAAEEKADELKKQYEEAMAGILQEKNEIVGGARGKAGAEYEKIVAEARRQADKILEDAKLLADREQEKRMRQAREQLADLVVAAAAKVAAAKASPEEDRELYNQFLARTGAGAK